MTEADDIRTYTLAVSWNGESGSPWVETAHPPGFTMAIRRGEKQNPGELLGRIEFMTSWLAGSTFGPALTEAALMLDAAGQVFPLLVTSDETHTGDGHVTRRRVKAHLRSPVPITLLPPVAAASSESEARACETPTVDPSPSDDSP